MRGPVRNVPPGYVVHRVADAWLVFDSAYAAELVALRLADPDARRRLFARAPKRGRGAAPSVSLRRDVHTILRRYQHGGLFGGITRNLYLGPSRALDELHVTSRAESSGAPVPHVLCLALWPAAGPFWSALIGTREERGARDLCDVLLALDDAHARRALLREVGTAVRKLHDAGVDHRDLQLHNILAVDEGEKRRIVVVDLDRAVYHPRAARSRRGCARATSGGSPARRSKPASGAGGSACAEARRVRGRLHRRGSPRCAPSCAAGSAASSGSSGCTGSATASPANGPPSESLCTSRLPRAPNASPSKRSAQRAGESEQAKRAASRRRVRASAQRAEASPSKRSAQRAEGERSAGGAASPRRAPLRWASPLPRA